MKPASDPVPDLQISIQFSQVWNFCQSEALADFSNRNSEFRKSEISERRQKREISAEDAAQIEPNCAFTPSAEDTSVAPEISTCHSEDSEPSSVFNDSSDSLVDTDSP